MEQTGAAELLADPEQAGSRRARMVRLADEYAERLHEVPVHLVVGVRLDDLAVTDAELPRQSIVGGASVYPVVQNLLLALRGEGLVTAMRPCSCPPTPMSAACWRSPEEVAWQHTSASATAPTLWPACLAPPRRSRSRSPRLRRPVRSAAQPAS